MRAISIQTQTNPGATPIKEERDPLDWKLGREGELGGKLSWDRESAMRPWNDPQEKENIKKRLKKAVKI